MTTTATSQSGLFAQLEPLLAHRAVLITVSKLDSDQFQVNICPRQLKEGENPALTIPLCVIGTAAELDADLVAQIAGFVSSHTGLNSNLATIEKEIAEAERAAREDAKKKHKAVGNGGKKTTDSVPSQPPIESKSDPEPPQTLGLFDERPSLAECELTAASSQAVADAE
jgi:PRTRC genetic system protein E